MKVKLARIVLWLACRVRIDVQAIRMRECKVSIKVNGKGSKKERVSGCGESDFKDGGEREWWLMSGEKEVSVKSQTSWLQGEVWGEGRVGV